MAKTAEAFVEVFGSPEEAAPMLTFPEGFGSIVWSLNAPQLGSGWYRDRFLCLFTESLQGLSECLDAWPFLVKPNSDRLIIGRNAHGAIAFVDDVTTGKPRFFVLDPLHVDALSNPGLDLWSFIGQYLPENRVPYFLDDHVYREFRANGGKLAKDEILAIDVPLTLDGKFELDNFHVENIYEHYKGTGPIYAKGFKKK